MNPRSTHAPIARGTSFSSMTKPMIRIKKGSFNPCGMCNTPVLTPFALNVYDVYILINRGVEIKEKAPPSIKCLMFRRLKSLPMVYHDIWHIIILASCNYAF